MILSKRETKRLYRRTAPFYDLALLAYRLIGVRRRRREAVRALQLQSGDTVVDMGCGTGLNFDLLHEAVGPAGRIVGVDLSGAMLQQAHRRVRRAGWRNVRLVEADLATYEFPSETKGALATFALEMVPEYHDIVRCVADRLAPGGRLALFGLKVPEHWPEWLLRLAVWLNKPFGASRDYAALRPWESVRRHMDAVTCRELYFGAAYLAVGERPREGASRSQPAE